MLPYARPNDVHLGLVDFDVIVTGDTATQLLRGGHPQALLGQPEAAWLDAKRAPYTLNEVQDKLEFAKDIAAFANSV